MPDPKPEFVFTTPPVACLFGEREHVLQLFPLGWSTQHEAWEVVLHHAVGAWGLSGPLLPEVIIANLRQAAKRHQRIVFEEHGRKVGQTAPFEPPMLVFHLDSEAEFALVQQLALGAIAVEVVARQPISEGTQAREGWPARCTKIGARPDCPNWVSADAHEHFGTWAKLARQRVLSLARAAIRESETF